MLYCVDLDEKRLEITEYDKKTIREDMEYFNLSNKMQLQTWDRRLFRTEREAQKFLTRYLLTLKRLPKLCKRHRTHPAMLYKRRYIVLTLMNCKLTTVRHYNKGWKRGQKFDLHDQTYFLTVTLRHIGALKDGTFRYHFSV